MIEYPNWVKFLVDFRLFDKKSKHNKKSDLDRIFAEIDALSLVASKADPTRAKKPLHDDNVKSLSRQEFIATLVQIATNKYIRAGSMKDISEALHRMLAEDILPNVDPRIFEVSNTFRAHCYTEEATKELSKRDTALRRIYRGLNKGQRGKEANLLSLDEWKAFIMGLEFIGPDLTSRDAALCFVFSRVAVVDARTDKGQLKEVSLPYEGFLECICRLAVLKALPTRADIEAAGLKDAGQFLMEKRRQDPQGYNQFLEERATRWGEEPKQPVHKCVEHLICLIIREIEDRSKGVDNFDLTQEEVDDWVKAHVYEKGHLKRVR